MLELVLSGWLAPSGPANRFSLGPMSLSFVAAKTPLPKEKGRQLGQLSLARVPLWG